VGHEDVLRLEIAVHETSRVCRAQSARDVSADAQNLIDRKRPSLDDLTQCFAFEQLRDEVRAVLRASNIEDADDIGMIERGRHAGLVHEPRDALWIAGFRGREHLDGNIATEPRIGRAIDISHSAAGDEVDHAVRSHHRAAWQRRLVLCETRGGDDDSRRFEKAVQAIGGG
jgi:hypothetical protein